MVVVCYDRYQLAEVIPGLRPWEVLSVEQAMDQITYNGEWHREALGSYSTGPPYIREWNKNFKVQYILCTRSYNFADLDEGNHVK